MTFSLRVNFLMIISALFAFASSAHAYAPMVAPPGPKSDSAELCQSVNGQVMVIQPFGQARATLVVYSTDKKREPVVKHGYRIQKELGGMIRAKEMSLDAFEDIAKPLDPESVLQDREFWSRAFEILFQGNVTVLDDQSKVVGKGPMSCSAAKVEYRVDRFSH